MKDNFSNLFEESVNKKYIEKLDLKELDNMDYTLNDVFGNPVEDLSDIIDEVFNTSNKDYNEGN